MNAGDHDMQPQITRPTVLHTGDGDGALASESDLPGHEGEPVTMPGGPADGAAGSEDPARMGLIGRFVVLRRLGAGGMGVVYLAYDNALDRRVAIKLIRSLAAPDPEQTARMRREAQAMARLSHPNVLQIYETGESEGSLFLTMEYVHGGSLGDWLSRHVSKDTSQPGAAWRTVVAMFVQAGRGLAAAHQAGLVHRDFKPENVLVGDDGVVRVSDFGLVRLLESEPPAPVTGGRATPLPPGTLTATRAVMGTPAYMSPEQHAGLPTDARTDQFSFCVALWEALYGERPFDGETLEALAGAIDRGVPGAAPAGSRVPMWLRAALVRGLARAPEARWPSMAALLTVLTDDPEARGRRRVVMGGGAVLLAAAMGVLAYATLEGQQRAEVADHRAGLAADERDRALASAEQAAVRARDTLRMSALRDIEHDPTSTALVLQEVEAPASTPEWTQTAIATLAAPISAAVLRGHSNVLSTAVFVGADEALVVTGAADRSARVWRRDGLGDPQVLPHERMVTQVVVSPDGRSFVTLGDTHARMWAVGAEAGAAVTPLRSFPGDAPTDLAAFDAEGRRLAVTDREGTVWLWEVETGRLLERLGGAHDGRVSGLAFDPSGPRFITRDFDGQLRLWRTDGGAHSLFADLGASVVALHIGADGPRMTATAAAVQLWSGADEPRLALRGHTGDIKDVAASPDGQHYATASADQTVRIWDAATGAVLATLEHGSSVDSVLYSPDGRWLATVAEDYTRLWRRDNPSIVHALQGYTPDGIVFSRDSSRLLGHASDHTARVWDLRHLADTAVFRAPGVALERAFGGCDLGRVAALGADGVLRIWDCLDRRPVTELTLAKSPVYDLEVDPALTRAAHVDEDGVWLVSLTDGQKRRVGVHPRSGWKLAFSPDGRHLVSTGYDRSAWVWDLDGDAPPVMLTGHTSALVWDAAWSPDGATIATIGNDISVRIWPIGPALADLRRGPVELQASRVFTGHTRGAKTLEFSPDGARLLSSSPDATARIWDPAGLVEPVVLEGHRGAIYAATWSPDGQRVATASEDGTARIWRPDGAAPPLVLRGHRAAVSAIAWRPDGRALVTASEDGTARVWAADRGQAFNVYTADGAVNSASFTGDGEHVLLAAVDGTARLWRPGHEFAPDPAAVMSRLRAATTTCLTARQRELILLEDTDQAWAMHTACEARHRRSVDPNEGVHRAPPAPTP